MTKGKWREVNCVAQVRKYPSDNTRYPKYRRLPVCIPGAKPEDIGLEVECPRPTQLEHAGFLQAEFRFCAETEPRQPLAEIVRCKSGDPPFGVRRYHKERQPGDSAQPGGTESAFAVQERRSGKYPVSLSRLYGVLPISLAGQKAASVAGLKAERRDMYEARFVARRSDGARVR